MRKTEKIAVIGKECVACGCCTSVCPNLAISIKWGVTALVDADKCLACKKCIKECPADVIKIEDRRKVA